jgi:hypothetical protein
MLEWKASKKRLPDFVHKVYICFGTELKDPCGPFQSEESSDKITLRWYVEPYMEDYHIDAELEQ